MSLFLCHSLKDGTICGYEKDDYCVNFEAASYVKVGGFEERKAVECLKKEKGTGTCGWD